MARTIYNDHNRFLETYLTYPESPCGNGRDCCHWLPHEIKGEGKMLSFLPQNISQAYGTAVGRGTGSNAVSTPYSMSCTGCPRHARVRLCVGCYGKVVDKASELGDLTTLYDHEAVQQIIKGHKHLMEQQKGH
ncbi:hypothetical protein RLOC_00011053 [Lonchura striata]|uniref:Uncharacterized protein n=1 Tax=Lonchura striata TaxID=40157 RepID=A0A218VDN6_9PASE|nr:hypothetical protein RLOC_00011053 [Lonchura striata domestica]